MQPTTSSTLPHHPIPLSWVESLFKRMTFSYGTRFADLWAGVDHNELKAFWADRLGALTRDELATGYRMMESLGRPPTLPEFIKLCRPNLDPEVAFYEAIEQGRKRELADPDNPDEWSHAAIYWAWVKVGGFAIANQGYEVLRSRWSETLRNCANDPHLPAVPKKARELPAPGKTRLQPERARELLADLKIKTLPASVVSRNTNWAELILERNQRGEIVSIAALEMAMAALGRRA